MDCALFWAKIRCTSEGDGFAHLIRFTPTKRRPVMSAASAIAFAPSSVSARKLRANRRNARKSTGPRTSAGKRTSSRNAVTHGLFCNELVLKGESHELFHGIRQGFIASLKPQNLVELLIVDRLTAATWKLRRLQS